MMKKLLMLAMPAVAFAASVEELKAIAAAKPAWDAAEAAKKAAEEAAKQPAPPPPIVIVNAGEAYNKLTAAEQVAVDVLISREADQAFDGGVVTALYMVMCGAIVMFMQAGFAMLTAGCAQEKNVQSVLLKNMIDICVATLAYWSMGYSIAYGISDPDRTGGFLGGETNWFLHDAVGDYSKTVGGFNSGPTSEFYGFFFQWAFTATTATIVSGGVMERVSFWAYAFYVFWMTAFIYPVVAHSTWGYGFIYGIYGGAYIDFAGSGVVHLTGGVGALCGAIILGPRLGRFETGVDQASFEPHNMALMTLGTIILWMGFYGFNAGSTLAFDNHYIAKIAGIVAVNSTIAAATGGMTAFLLATLSHGYENGIYGLTAHIFRKLMCQKDERTKKPFPELKMDLCELCNGVLGGLVSITAGCSNTLPSGAFCAGLIGGIVYLMASKGLQMLKIDDPINAFAVHGACGMWGVWAAALFDAAPGFQAHHGWSGLNAMDGVGTGEAMAANTAEIAFIWGWVGSLSLILFGGLNAMGVLRLDKETEEMGLDALHHVQTQGYRSSTSLNNSPAIQAELKQMAAESEL